MRNKLEGKVRAQLGPEFTYETLRLSYTLTCQYLPDFVDAETKRIVEVKGLFTAEDRRKHRAIRDQHPDWSVTILFQNPNAKLRKGSPTTYADWCAKNGIAWGRA